MIAGFAVIGQSTFFPKKRPQYGVTSIILPNIAIWEFLAFAYGTQFLASAVALFYSILL